MTFSGSSIWLWITEIVHTDLFVQYLMAYEGYLAEGKILEADEQKALYLAKKAEIRERFPDK